MNDSSKTGELLNRETRSIHLFAGAGGGILGDILLNHRPVAAVEIDQYCRRVLNRRQKEGHLPFFPIFKNVKEFDGKPWRGLVDVVAGGFPCQPYSTAGKGKGDADERNLWPDTIRIIREVGPAVAFLENVPGLLSFDYFGQIIGDLAESGFDAKWDVISAASLGAPHQRDRLWIFAWNNTRMGNPASIRFGNDAVESRNQSEEKGNRGMPSFISGSKDVADAGEDRFRFQRDETGNGKEPKKGRTTRDIGDGDTCRDVSDSDEQHDDSWGYGTSEVCRKRWKTAHVSRSEQYRWWDIEPGLGRVADVVDSRVDRLKAIGNGQVPCVAAFAMLMLAERAGIDLSQLWRFRNVNSDND